MGEAEDSKKDQSNAALIASALDLEVTSPMYDDRRYFSILTTPHMALSVEEYSQVVLFQDAIYEELVAKQEIVYLTDGHIVLREGDSKHQIDILDALNKWVNDESINYGEKKDPLHLSVVYDRTYDFYFTRLTGFFVGADYELEEIQGIVLIR